MAAILLDLLVLEERKLFIKAEVFFPLSIEMDDNAMDGNGGVTTGRDYNCKEKGALSVGVTVCTKDL